MSYGALRRYYLLGTQPEPLFLGRVMAMFVVLFALDLWFTVSVTVKFYASVRELERKVTPSPCKQQEPL